MAFFRLSNYKLQLFDILLPRLLRHAVLNQRGFFVPWNPGGMFWWVSMIAIGVWMAISGFTKSNATPFKYLVARAALLWKSNAHSFLGGSGLVIALVGTFLLISK